MLILPSIIGHRGAGGYAPENTLASLRKAHEMGLTWIEMDVVLTSDNALVMFHDASLTRTTNGKGLLRSVTLSYVKSLDAGSWFSPAFAGEKVPTFQEVLLCCRQLGLNINIELKVVGDEEAYLVDQVLTELQTYWPTGSPLLLLSSFSIKVLKKLRAQHCIFPLAWNLEIWREDWQKMAEALGVCSLHYPAKLLTRERVDKIKLKGHRVLAYTVNELEEANRLFALGVDGVFSDVGDKIRQ